MISTNSSANIAITFPNQLTMVRTDLHINDLKIARQQSPKLCGRSGRYFVCSSVIGVSVASDGLWQHETGMEWEWYETQFTWNQNQMTIALKLWRSARQHGGPNRVLNPKSSKICPPKWLVAGGCTCLKLPNPPKSLHAPCRNSVKAPKIQPKWMQMASWSLSWTNVVHLKGGTLNTQITA